MTLKRHQDRLRRMAAQAAPVAARALYRAGQEIQTEAQRSITAGAVSGINHVPSAPGEPPNNDSGFLARNIETEIGGPNLVKVTSYAPYSAALEFGSSRGLSPRPFMRPAATKSIPEIERIVGRAVRTTIR